MQDVAGIGGELREARKDMALQATKMREMGDMTDEMMGHVENLATVFHQIDAEQQRGNAVNPGIVKSTFVHVQGTASEVKEPAGHVQTEPSSVINLVSGEYEEEERQTMTGRDYIKNLVHEQYQKIKEEIRSEEQPATASTPKSTAAASSTPQMTSVGASSSFGQHLSQESNPQVMTSSQMAEKCGENVAPTLFGIQGIIIPPYHQRNAVDDDVHRPSPTQETERPRVIVNSPPRLPSRTQKAIENIVQAHMERLGINAQSQQENQGERESKAGNIPNPGPETSQFSFPRMQDNVAPTSGQQVFATARWRPKKPPMFTGAATDEVYLWMSLVK